jgi:hypothetical protein
VTAVQGARTRRASGVLGRLRGRQCGRHHGQRADLSYAAKKKSSASRLAARGARCSLNPASPGPAPASKACPAAARGVGAVGPSSSPAATSIKDPQARRNHSSVCVPRLRARAGGADVPTRCTPLYSASAPAGTGRSASARPCSRSSSTVVAHLGFGRAAACGGCERRDTARASTARACARAGRVQRFPAPPSPPLLPPAR